MDKTEIKLETLIYYFKNNKVHSAPVLAICKVENLFAEWAKTDKQKEIFTPFGETGTFFATVHGIFPINEVFTSKRELAESLIKDDE